MQRRRTLPVSLAIVSLLLTGSCRNREAEQAAQQAAAASRFATIRDLANRACLCDMAGRDSSAINARLARATAGLLKDGAGEASYPLAGVYDCYPELGANLCTSRFYVVGAPGSPMVCSDDQVAALEETYSRNDDSGGDDRAFRALNAHLNRMCRELATTISQADCS